MRFGPKFVGGSAVRPPDVDGCEMTCTGPITTTARTADSRTTSRRIAPPHAHFYNRDADVTRDSRATLPEAKRRSQATNRDVEERFRQAFRPREEIRSGSSGPPCRCPVETDNNRGPVSFRLVSVHSRIA